MSHSQLGIIFDMDGVLVDSTEAHYHAFNQIGKKLGREFSMELFRECFGWHNNEIFPKWLGSDLPKEQAVALGLEKEALYRELAPQYVKPIPGVVQLIDSLVASGFKLAVGSSGPRANVEMALGVVGRKDRFHAIVCGDDVLHGKPDPEIFLTAANRIGVRPPQCLVIEDAVAGIQAARSAGMKVLGLTSSLPASKLSEATRVVDSLEAVGPATLTQLILAN